MQTLHYCKKVVLLLSCILLYPALTAAQNQPPKITHVAQHSATRFELTQNNNRHIIIDFYNTNIFRMVVDSTANELRSPYAEPNAQILVDMPKQTMEKAQLSTTDSSVAISTSAITLHFDKATSFFEITDKKTGKTVVKSIAPITFRPKATLLTLNAQPDEYFYGGGVQNGRFSHKDEAIAIVNQNSWTDGGVASPAPFYWSTKGYGLMWFTFKKGHYNFDAKTKGEVLLKHATTYLDVFFMIDQKPTALLNDYYQLTGHPVLLPKFAFYEGHLNAYNRDYWKQDSTGILFEDGLHYSESHKDNGGVKESLNGEKNNYQFSARAVIDRYAAHNMPLGWILPNDGYGAGYGQTNSLEGNIQNLKHFGDYATAHGVELGLWTQSDLFPKEGVEALLQRDIVAEVRDAGVRVLKTDVAWVGAGYSFGLHGIAKIANIMTKFGHNARPFIITVDGWAGTQRYAAVWTGDQTGGNWEYIRFHIPSFIGAGLSGLSNITADMDGIFGGKNPIVNARSFEWRTFTPMQLNMDGWGTNPKYPQALGEPTTSINRNYLKLKSALLPYTYSIAHQAIDGRPMIRAMFLEYPNEFTHSKATKYQFMYGPYFLVAPIYQNTQMDERGYDVRHNIYLPKGHWIDYFSGRQYQGNRVINYYDAPLWKLPVFIKPGAIIPMVNPNNSVSEINHHLRIFELYPYGESTFTLYNDDGKTMDYKTGESVSTLISSTLDDREKATVTIAPTKGDFNGFVKQKTTILKFNVSEKPGTIKAYIGGKRVKLQAVNSAKAFNNGQNVYFYNTEIDLNRFATKGSEFAEVEMRKNPQVWVKLESTDITKNDIVVQLSDYVFDIANDFKHQTGELNTPKGITVVDSSATAFTLTPSWDPVKHADYYEIMFNGMRYSHIVGNSFLFDNLAPDHRYTFKLRAVNKSGHSNWVEFDGRTQTNPLQYAIRHIAAYATAPSQAGFGVQNLTDFDETSLWHSKYHNKAVPFDLVLDLRSVNSLEKFKLLPRKVGANGLFTKGEVYYSTDKKTWTPAGEFEWRMKNTPKTFTFEETPTARYIKIHVTKAVGNYGSGREIYVFKVPGTPSYIPGDINSDGAIDHNDLTSYTNYTGLRLGDSDFEGYISKGDVNKNDLIDAFDISNAATQLNGGTRIDSLVAVSGSLVLSTPKSHYKKGETIRITVAGKALKAVNALSFAIPYNTEEYRYLGLESVTTKTMRNMTKDRLHTSGQKALYPTFVNIGNKPTLNGNDTLFVLKFIAKKDLTFSLKAIDGILVNKSLDTVKF